jgi:hypothetical protein
MSAPGVHLHVQDRYVSQVSFFCYFLVAFTMFDITCSVGYSGWLKDLDFGGQKIYYRN